MSARSGAPEIWLADHDGANPIQLTSMGAVSAGMPQWSADGRTIAFDSNLEGGFDVYVIAASGGRPRRITTHTGDDYNPSFSQGGKSIYFGSNRSGRNEIWKTPVSGDEAAVQVTQNGGFAAVESPDGNHLYYSQGGYSSPLGGLWRVPTSGGDPVKVLDAAVGRNFAVTERGVYYIELQQQPGPLTVGSNGRPYREHVGRLRFLDFGTASSRTLADLGRGLGNGITMTPDSRTFLFTKRDVLTNDLMLVENFR